MFRVCRTELSEQIIKTFLRILTPDQRRQLILVGIVMAISVVVESTTLILVAKGASLFMEGSGGFDSIRAYLPSAMEGISDLRLTGLLVLLGVSFLVLKNCFVAFQLRYQFRFAATVLVESPELAHREC